MIEGGLQFRIGRRDDGGAGHLRQQRRRFRRLQRREVAPEKIGFFGPVQRDATEPVMKHRAAAEYSCQRRIDGVAGAVETVAQSPAQPANAGTIRDFREHSFRIEPGDKNLGAGGIGHKTGGNANGAIGSEEYGRCR